MATNGFVQITRGVIFDDFFRDRPYNKLGAWTDLVASANYAESHATIGKNSVTIKRGQALVSINGLATRWGWSRSRVNRFLRELTEKNLIKTERANRDTNDDTNHDTRSVTIVTVENYGIQGTSRANRDTNNDTNRDANNAPHHNNKTKKEDPAASPPDDLRALRRKNEEEFFRTHGYHSLSWDPLDQ